MKKLFAALALFACASTTHAALFITNNTGCDLGLRVTAHDPALPGACSYYTWIEMPQGTARAYNNVAELNNGWTLNTTGIPVPATISAAGDWDAVWFFDAAYTIGNPGTCATGTSISYSGSTSCPYTATWTNLGGGNIVITINP